MIVNCANCQLEFDTSQYKLKHNVNNFCSNECRANFQYKTTINKVLTHKYYGDLEVIEYAGIRKEPSKQNKRGFAKRHIFLCKCRCGKVYNVQYNNLHSKVKCRQCALDHIGELKREKTIQKVMSQKFFGDLEVIGPNGYYKHPDKFRAEGYNLLQRFDCKCKCGTITSVTYNNLLGNKSTQCYNCKNRQISDTKQQPIINAVLAKQHSGDLKVIGIKGKAKSGSTIFNCQCNCGKVLNVPGHRFLHPLEAPKSCRNCSKRHYKGEFGLSFRQAIKSANARNIPFHLSLEYIEQLFKEQNGKCYYSGLPLEVLQNTKHQQSGKRTASLDRLDSSKGYFQGNVVWCHKDINYMKQSHSESTFLSYCKSIAEFNGIYPPFLRVIIDNTDFNFRGYKEISATTIGHLKTSAIRRNYEFSITIEDIWAKYVEQGGICALSGIPTRFCPFTKRNPNRFAQTASVDRIDSTKGYTRDNIQIVYKPINFMKQDFDQDYFTNLCKKVTQYQKEKVSCQ